MDDSQGEFEVDDADALEQLTNADGSGPASEPADPEDAVGTLSGADLDAALGTADEADLAEQAQEVPYDDDFEQ